MNSFDTIFQMQIDMHEDMNPESYIMFSLRLLTCFASAMRRKVPTSSNPLAILTH